MPTPLEPWQEHPSTYMVQDRSNQEELTRLQSLDRWTTAGMGGVLAEQADPAIFQRVLDIGCGTGGWLLETARIYPHISLLIGVDVNNQMVQFARNQAEVQQLDERVEFHVMDALRMLEFPNDYFDLVNVRSAMSYLRTWDWLKFLEECRRVSRPGGVVRVTEWNIDPPTTSLALTRLLGLMRVAFYQAGHLPTPAGDSVIQSLPALLKRFDFQNVQTKEHRLVDRPDTQGWQFAYDNARLGFRNILPFLQKWLRIPDDYQEIYQQMLSEMQQPDFESTTILFTAWGNTPPRQK